MYSNTKKLVYQKKKWRLKMTSTLVFIVAVLAGLTILRVLTEETTKERLYYGMPVDVTHNGILSHGYVTTIKNETVIVVLFDYPHDLVEVKITELIF